MASRTRPLAKATIREWINMMRRFVQVTINEGGLNRNKEAESTGSEGFEKEYGAILV